MYQVEKLEEEEEAKRKEQTEKREEDEVEVRVRRVWLVKYKLSIVCLLKNKMEGFSSSSSSSSVDLWGVQRTFCCLRAESDVVGHPPSHLNKCLFISFLC